jgi:hypothetical protein
VLWPYFSSAWSRKDVILFSFSFPVSLASAMSQTASLNWGLAQISQSPFPTSPQHRYHSC